MNIIKKISFLIILMILTFYFNIRPSEGANTSNNIITFFVETKPEIETKNLLNNEEEKINNDTIEEINPSKELISIPDLRVTYFGWTTVSDNKGQIVLPLKKTQSGITLIITPAIKPVLLNDALVSYFVLDAPATSYKINEFKDEKAKKSYWQITKSKLEKNKKIPVDAIVILANPENIDLKNMQPMTPNPNTVLPKLDINPKILKDMDDLALNFIEISNYFSVLNMQKKVTDKTISNILEYIT